MTNENISSQQAKINDTRMSSGIPGLDFILEGGFPANRIYLVEGEPGTGKTTLALQFLMAGVQQNEPVLYVTLSETEEELTSAARTHGWSLEGVHIHELLPTGDALKPETQYTIFHPSEIELNETTGAVLEEVERINPARVVFDSLSEMRLLARDPLRYRRQILALKQYFIGRKCTVLLLDDKTNEPQDLQLQSIVHGVVSLDHLAMDYGSERRRMRVVKLRGSKFCGGFHDFNIETGGMKVFPRLVAADHQNAFGEGDASSASPELDSLLGGGLTRGTSTLLIGPSGSGKSTLAAQFAIAAAERGEKASLFIFDETRNTFIRRISGIGTDIQGHLDSGQISLQQVDPAELSPGEFAHQVMHTVKNDGASVVVIDSLNGYLNSMPQERFLALQMHELLTYLNQQGVMTILIMAQHGFIGANMMAPVDVSYLADSVILLRYFEAEGAIRRAVSVIKKRSGPHEETIRELTITSQGICVGQPLTKFHGVLTGVPLYDGSNVPLLDTSDNNG